MAWNVKEGTIEQRERIPELNTKNFDMHERRLEQFSKSKDKNRMFYIGVDGTCYYYLATGRKIFLMDEISQWGIAALIGTSIAAFLAWFNKSGSDFKDGFGAKSKSLKKKK